MVTFEARWYDAAGRRHSASYDTAAEADRARQERLRERRRGGSGDPTGGRMSLEAWWGRWMPSRRITDSTKEREEAIWRRHIEPTFGGYRLVDLRRSDIAAWSVSLDRTLAPATVGRCLLLLKKCLSDAVAEGMIAASPAASVAPPERGRVERRFLSLDELQRLEAAVEAWWGLVVPFAATTGLRIGEIAALKVGDLGLAARGVRVSATAVGVSRRVSGDEIRRQVHRPKTTAGERVVPTITDELAERLAVHIDERGLSLDDWLFSGRRGGPMDPAEAEERLDDRERQQLGVRQLRAQADLGPRSSQLRAYLQFVVDLDIQCGREGVEVGVHEASRVDRWDSTRRLWTPSARQRWIWARRRALGITRLGTDDRLERACSRQIA